MYLLAGGYDLQGLSEGVTDSFRALLGEGSGEPGGAAQAVPGLGEEPVDKVRRVLTEAKALHQL